MTKAQQKEINERAYDFFDTALSQFRHGDFSIRKLRSCQAKVYETSDFYLLQSYNTFVACIDKYTGILVDVLRTEYGYTPTSAQHISKFASDYLCIPKWQAKILTTREV